MADTADTANVIVRPPIAWALAVLAGLALNWLMLCVPKTSSELMPWWNRVS